MDCGPPGSSVHGILQARILEWLPFPPPILLIGGCKIHRCCVPLIWGSQASFLPNIIQDLLWLSLSIFSGVLLSFRASLWWKLFTTILQVVKYLPAMWDTRVRSLGWEEPLEKGMATHSSILARRIPMDRGAWRASVHGVAKSQTRLSDFTFLSFPTFF